MLYFKFNKSSFLKQNVRAYDDDGDVFTLQGTVLSAFFWGYATTQVIGGYLSDRCGAKVVMISAMTGWSVLTMFTPLLTRTCCDGSRRAILHMFVLLRILTGCVQGISLSLSH